MNLLAHTVQSNLGNRLEQYFWAATPFQLFTLALLFVRKQVSTSDNSSRLIISAKSQIARKESPSGGLSVCSNVL